MMQRDPAGVPVNADTHVKPGSQCGGLGQQRRVRVRLRAGGHDGDAFLLQPPTDAADDLVRDLAGYPDAHFGLSVGFHGPFHARCLSPGRTRVGQDQTGGNGVSRPLGPPHIGPSRDHAAVVEGVGNHFRDLEVERRPAHQGDKPDQADVAGGCDLLQRPERVADEHPALGLAAHIPDPVQRFAALDGRRTVLGDHHDAAEQPRVQRRIEKFNRAVLMAQVEERFDLGQGVKFDLFGQVQIVEPQLLRDQQRDHVPGAGQVNPGDLSGLVE